MILVGQLGGQPYHLKLSCPVRAKIAQSLEEVAQLQSLIGIPSELVGVFQAELSSSEFLPRPSTRIQGILSGRVNRAQVKESPLKTSGEIFLQGGGQISEFPRRWDLKGETKWFLTIPHFEELVRRLQQSRWAVWAPFSVFKGEVALHIAGQSNVNRGHLSMNLNTALHSMSEDLHLEGKGDLNLERLLSSAFPQVDFDLELKRVRLELPQLSFTSFPRLVPDPRIRSTRNHQTERNHRTGTDEEEKPILRQGHR